ncbi:MAG: hypothetical protein K0B14_11100 [Anaerolineaceae bacterium]|nr:hypothetical protein [Anaerolineaceae bacterium]
MIKKIRLFSILLILLLLAGNSGVVHAQDYYFAVEKQTMDVFVNEDGSLSIEYYFDLVNQPGAHPIDIIDIGLPNNNYVLSSITADINGLPVDSIEKSDYIDIGIMVGLGNQAIQPGQRGNLHVFVGTINKSLYPSEVEANEDYASFEISPTWFGSQYVTGSTDLSVTLYLPIGLTENEPRYHTPRGWSGDSTPISGFDNQGGIYYTWSSPNANAYTQYTFGASFPARMVPEAQIVKAPTITFDSDAICSGLICLGMFAFFALTIYSATIGAKKRKLKYLPPKISVEGHGIKRGLTAVEAAILMEQPMDRVLMMVLFSVLKKGAAEVITRDPLKIKVTEPKPEGLQPYEEEFLTAMQKDKKGQRTDLQTMIINLVSTVSKKMKGFSRKESIAFYKDIMEKAWNQVETAQTPEIKSEKFDENMDWTMLDKNFDGRTKESFGSGPVFIPIWWWRYDPMVRPTTSSTPSFGKVDASPMPSGSGQTSINLPSLPGADFAASITNGVQSFASGVVGDLTKFTSGITNKTNPIPKSTSSSGRSSRGGGGGGSCACACACAGCACACAGGGR